MTVWDFVNIPIDQHIRRSDQTKTDHKLRGRHGHDGMVAGLQKHVQSVPMYKSCEFESWQGVLDTLSDKVCQLFAVGLWFTIGYSDFLHQ